MAEGHHAAERRRAILAAAETAFDRHGFAATTIDEVAAEAGVSKGNIYNYFHSKEDLFRHVFQDVVSVAEAELTETIKAEVPAEQKLNRMLDYWYERLERYRRVGRLVLECWATAARQQQGELVEWLSAVYARLRGMLAGVIEQGMRSGEFRAELQPALSARLIMAVLDGLEVQTIIGIGERVDSPYLEALKRAVARSLRSPASSSGTS
jgi:AcrR family transcriptional regulator